MIRPIPIIERPLTILVAGGTGFVGHELIARLARAGHEIRVPTRSAARADELRTIPNLELATGDVYATDFLRRLLDGCDVAINLIGILNESGHGGAGFRRAHVEFTRALLRAIETAKVPRLLQMSALNADAERGRSHYLRTKGEAERLVRNATGIDWTIFRPSVIFGAGDSLTNRFARLLRASGGFLPLARAGARFAPVYVGDVADAFMRALYGGESSQQTFELCGPEVMTLEQLVRLTARVAQLPCHIWRLPDALGRTQAALLDWVPGKPFSTDNYRSLLIDSVCHGNGCEMLGIRAAHCTALAPTWLAPEASPSPPGAPLPMIDRQS